MSKNTLAYALADLAQLIVSKRQNIHLYSPLCMHER